MGFAVFLEPGGNLREAILGWKTKVSRLLPDQPFCSHPPHCTLVHTEVISEGTAFVQLRSILPQIPPFKVLVDQVGIFWNDDATGGHTLYLRITPDPKLNELQMYVAESLKNIVHPTRVPAFVKNDPVSKNSYENYGYPFAGPHWIPHLSIASLRVEMSHPLIAEFLSWQPGYMLKVNELSCWSVDVDDHVLIGKHRFS